MGRGLVGLHPTPLHHDDNTRATMQAPQSLLAVPADKARLLESALRRPASALMVDLEDGVAPSEKDTARAAMVEFVNALAGDVTIFVRINEPESATGRRDLQALLTCIDRLAGIIVPKSTASTVAAVAGAIRCPIVALIETAHGVEDAFAISSAPAVIGLMFGSVDYASDISAVGGWHISNLGWTKSRLINAAAAGGAWAIAGPSTALADGAELASEVDEDRSLGFAGKLCIHPAQIGRVNSAFKPSADQSRWASRVLEAVGEGDVGAIRVDGQMIDKPVIDRARTILAADGSALA